MKVNFNSMRISATQNMNRLHEIIAEIIENDYILESEAEQLEEQFNECAIGINSFNYLEDEKEDNFDALDISVNIFEDEEEL